MKTLETERLILRGWQKGDFEAAHAYGSVADNVTYMGWGPNTEEDTRNFIKRSIKNNKKNLVDYAYAVILKESGKLIGGCDISISKNQSEGSLGWILHKDYWKQGLGTELAKELLRFGFEELKLHRICATCDSVNYGSYRVTERNGMRKEGNFIQSRKNKNEWCDEFLYAILEDEWKDLQL
ncbi:MAG: GNAT family protein [Eubacteriales bacterium]